MFDILKKISAKDRFEFSKNFDVKLPDFALVDQIFPDRKTQNFEAEFTRLSNTAMIPRAAMVHAYDTETEIGQRPGFESISAEKLLIKEKIDQGENLRKYLDRLGNAPESTILEYIYNDMANEARVVATKTKLMKLEALATGKVTVHENNLNFVIDYNVPDENRVAYTWSDPTHDILGDIEAMIALARTNGKIVTGAVTTPAIMAAIRKNTALRTAMLGALNEGKYVSEKEVKAWISENFGFSINVVEGVYNKQAADGTLTATPVLEADVFTLYVANGGVAGVGLWGPTPDEQSLLALPNVSQSGYITIHQWNTDDPVTTWTRASGVFVPVLPDPYGTVVATITVE